MSALALLGGCTTQLKTASTPARPQRVCRYARPPAPIPGWGPQQRRWRGFPEDVMSAASDWSRWPLGTKFRIVGTDDIFKIDDYGSALIGTGTIDLYKTNRLEMRKWGVRSVDIDVLEWGSPQRSLEVLTPRKSDRRVRAMILALSRNTQITRPF